MTAVDGRVERGARNRAAIADALLACYDAGMLRPGIAEIAARAGVSVRSVHNHFSDIEALRADVAQRQWERHAALLQPVTDVAALAAQRRTFFEAITPVRRAGLLSIHDSPTIARRLAHLDRLLREQLRALFPRLDADALDATDAVASWDAWNRLRTAQGCDADRAQRILEHTIRMLTEGRTT